MNELELLIRQNSDVHRWTKRILHDIPMEKWDNTPDTLKTNVSWQVGHLTISNIYHCITLIHGAPKELFGKVDIRTMAALYGMGSDPVASAGQTSTEVLMERLMLVQKECISSMERVTADQLDQPLEPTRFPHPVAKIKREVLSWNVQHVMWHCGQLGLIKRLIDKRLSFIPS